MKVGIITNMPTPYREKMWEIYNEIKNIDITYFYCTKREKDRKWIINNSKNKNIFLKGISFKTEYHLNIEIVKHFKKQDFWIIGGYSSPTYIILIMLCIFFRKPYALLIDGINPQMLNKKSNFIIEIIKTIAIRKQSYSLANGKIGKLFLKKYKYEEEKIFNQYLTIDTKLFSLHEKKREEIKALFRKKYEMNEEEINLLYVGRLIKGKGIEDIIKFVLENKDLKLNFIIVGDGDYKEELLKLSLKSKQIIFIGNVEYDNLYKYYYSSDIFILPSHSDVWGLVLNEAMTCSLPVITTTSCGAFYDLICNNGFIYEAGNLSEFKEKFIKEFGFKRNEKFIKIIENYGNRSKDIISQINYLNSKRELEKIIKNLKNKKNSGK